MSKYRVDIFTEKHSNELSLGFNLGASWRYKFLRMSITILFYTFHLGIDEVTYV